ncbi:MAG: ribonuclease R family protein [Paracoccaceae bacterium]
MTDIPDRAAILAFAEDNPGRADRRSIARAFGLKGHARLELKRTLREMAKEGLIADKPRRPAGTLAPVAVLRVTGADPDGDLWAEPAEWPEDPAPRIVLRDPPALADGDRVLARLDDPQGATAPGAETAARVIRPLGRPAQRILGVFRAGSEGGRIAPVDKGEGREWDVPPGATAGARDGELVEAERAGPRSRMGLPRARVTARLGDPTGPRAVSLIAIHAHGIPDAFPQAVLDAAAAATEANEAGREDLRHLPLVTIDPEDARDHDDAVCAEALPEDAGGGHAIWVAIADVAHHVPSGGALDVEARKRGNSTYFPDRVVPMLPDALSGDLCSLHEGVDRPCIAVRMEVGPDGRVRDHRFARGLMRSPAALTYEQAQAAVDGAPDEATAPHLPALRTLWDAWGPMAAARAGEGLDLDLPERRIVLSEAGEVLSVAHKDRLDAHRLIETLMVAANVAAARTLIAKRTPLLFRVHEPPEPERLEALRETAEAAGLKLSKGQTVTPAHLNRLLARAAGTDDAELINMAVLRSMQQAYYDPTNLGHFGLGLGAYAHFTSPIRRYADLVVHRALATAHGWPGGLTEDDRERLRQTAEHISMTERRSMLAERDTTDRYLAAFLADRVGAVLPGRISGVARFGAFAKLDETGADALIPIATLGDEYFDHDRDAGVLRGTSTGLTVAPGMAVTVELREADPITGGLIAELVTLGDATLGARGTGRGRTPKARGRGKPPRGKAGRTKLRRKSRG